LIEELERVALTGDLPAHHLKAGDMGTIVDITPNRQQFTVEFLTLDGETFVVVPLLAHQIRRVGSHEIANARVMET